MKVRVLLIFMILSSGFAQSQAVDTCILRSASTPPEVKIEMTLPHTGFNVSRIENTVQNNTVYIDIFFRECAGFTAITPFDTVVNSGSSNWPVMPENIVVVTFLDTLTVSALNCYYRSSVKKTDSFNISKGAIDLDERGADKKQVKVYPIPASRNLQVESDGAVLGKGTIYSAKGKKIRSIKNIGGAINVSNLLPGVYFLRLKSEKSIAMKKFLVD